MGPNKNGVALWWKVSGRNKRSVTLDLHRKEGRKLAKELIKWADVIITSFRTSTLKEWELDWDSITRINSKAIVLQVTGYGREGPRSNKPGFGKMGEARSGVVYITGFPDSPPVHTGFSQGDILTGLMGAFAIAAALSRKASDPLFSGELIDQALFDTLFRLIEWQIIVFDQLGLIPERQGNRLYISPGAVINTYLTADQQWITITSATEKSVINIVKMLNLSIEDFDSTEKQLSKRDYLDKHLREWVASKSLSEIIELCDKYDVVAEKIFNVKDIVNDEIYQMRKSIIKINDAELGSVRMQDVFPKLLNYKGEVWRTGPKLGEDNELVYIDWLGISKSEYEYLSNNGII